MLYTNCLITVFIILIEHNINIGATPIKIAHDLLFSKNETTLNHPNNILSDSKVFDNELTTLHEQLKSKTITNIKIEDLVLKEFQNIESILHDLDVKVNTKPDSKEFVDNNELELSMRNRRSVPRATLSECKMSHEMLVNLEKEIKNALQNASQTRSNNCELQNNALSCHELIKYIECGINHLRNGFTNAISKRNTSTEFTAWKNAFETLSAAYVKMVDNMKQNIEQKYKTEIDNLKTAIQLLLKIIKILDNKPCVIYAIFVVK